MKRFLLVLPLLLAAGCNDIPSEAYYTRGAPESLLDVSSEIVNLSIASEPALDELAEWVNRDQPTRAELYCMDGDQRCAAAQEILDLYGVPSSYVAAQDTTVTLVYERVIARDCENRYIDNSVNPYHLNHPTFGCSVAGNMVQMVSDKQQFVSPNLLDYQDGRKAVQVYRNYLEAPRTPNQLRQAESALTRTALEELSIDQ